jgi:hypothetical protein
MGVSGENGSGERPRRQQHGSNTFSDESAPATRICGDSFSFFALLSFAHLCQGVFCLVSYYLNEMVSSP